ncbi:MAG: hypothetical protein H7Z72_12090 [Bacteroidetes bacterium]|nr:hypothetical protein [Fibrella sp.]
MILNDGEITDLITTLGLVGPIEPRNLSGCGYTFRVGQIFEPETGRQVLDDKTPGHKIPPNGTAIIMTKEMVKMPDFLCANYTPLFRLAKEGILLMNASLVEPLYEGHLSCFFVNLSSKDFVFTRDQDVAKIVFLKLTQVPKSPQPLKISEENYKKALFEQATKFHESFLNIKGIEEKIVEKTQVELGKTKEAINSSLKFGGGLLVLLLTYSSLEPFFAKMIWNRSPVLDSKIELLERQILRDATFRQGTNDLLQDLLVKDRALLKRDSSNRVELVSLRQVVDSLRKK